MKAAPGHEVYALTPDQLKEWKASVAPLQKAWAEAVKKAGGDPDALYKDFEATVAKYRRGFDRSASLRHFPPAASGRG